MSEKAFFWIYFIKKEDTKLCVLWKGELKSFLFTEQKCHQLHLAAWKQITNAFCTQLSNTGAMSPGYLGPLTSNMNDFVSIKCLLENK